MQQSSATIMGSVIYAATTLGFLGLGLLVGRWLILVLPPIVWTIVAIGLSHRWWGRRPGEFLALGTFLLSLLGVIAVLGGIVIHRRMPRLIDRH